MARQLGQHYFHSVGTDNWRDGRGAAVPFALCLAPCFR